MKKEYTYICNNCNKKYTTFNKSNFKTHYCSKKCLLNYRHNIFIEEHNKNILTQCKECNKNIFISKYDLKKKQNFFCSKSCSTKYYNEHKINIPLNKREEINKKISQSFKSKYIPKKCQICGNNIPFKKKRKTCSIECEKKLREIHQAHVGGGYRQGSSRGHHGYYKGYYCDSTYELAFLIYCLDHNIPIQRCKESFEYEYNGKKHLYHPDFIINNEIIEIKNFYKEINDIKLNAVKDRGKNIKILYFEDLIEIFKYIIKKYNKKFNFKTKYNNFFELYEK